MKKLLFGLLLLVVGFASCTQTPQQKCRYTIAVKYMDNSLDTLVITSTVGSDFELKTSEVGFFSPTQIEPTLYITDYIDGYTSSKTVIASSVKRFTIIKIDTIK